MDYGKRNTWRAKIKRTFTSILPVSKNIEGKCVECGECCRLPEPCIFLKSDNHINGEDKGKSYCSIYAVRPLNCRKYPRTESEHITEESCGFKFDK